MNFYRGLAAATLLIVSTLHAPAGEADANDRVDLACRQSDPLSIECSYKVFGQTQLNTATARFNEVVLDGVVHQHILSPGDTTAVLFLIDRSDLDGDAIIAARVQHIRKLIQRNNESYAYGLAAFDSEIEVLCQLGCSVETLENAARKLTANGHTSELYRNTLGAIQQLQSYDASRRQLVLMSDGFAEDLAYYHKDVVAAAQDAGITIISIGYLRSADQSAALQALRRLSEETGGIYVTANRDDFELPPAFFSDAAIFVDNAGTAEFDLLPLQQAGVFGTIEMSLAFKAGEQQFKLKARVAVPSPDVRALDGQAIKHEPEADTARASDTKKLSPPINTDASTSPSRPDFWYGLPAIVFSIVLVVALIHSIGSRRHRDKRATSPSVAPAAPHAFLIAKQDHTVRHTVAHTPWRIGRSRNSDLRIDDTSVSRLHAEIRRDALGQFTVQDLESLNGVYVNGSAVDIIHLDEEDEVEIGDISFTFTLLDEQYPHRHPTTIVTSLPRPS